jgi:hypothetical protein
VRETPFKLGTETVVKLSKEHAVLFLPHQKTKTKTARRIPVSSRPKAVLEMRRFDPAGQPHALDRFVFGTEIGTRVESFDRAWHTAVLKSHGHKPAYTETANLTPELRTALNAIDLHFHDLRRACHPDQIFFPQLPNH